MVYLYLAQQFARYITDIEVILTSMILPLCTHLTMMIASQYFFYFDRLDIFVGKCSLALTETHISFYSNHLAIWHSFPNITHIKVNNDQKLAILNLIELNFFKACPYLKLHILLYSDYL